MKYRKPSEHEGTLYMVVLYQDDIARLMDILSRSASANVALEYRDVIYETLTELRDAHGDLIRELKLRATATDANAHRVSLISFTGPVVYLHFDAIHELAFWQARDFLGSRCHWTARWPTCAWIFQWRNWIFLHRRHEHTGFVKRHESTIIKALFGLAGSIIGYVLRLLQE